MDSGPRDDGAGPIRTLSDGAADLDLLDQMLMDDCWLEFPDCSDLFQLGSPNAMSPFNSLSFSPLFEVSTNGFPQDGGSAVPADPLPGHTQSVGPETIGRLVYSVQSGELHARGPGADAGLSWRIQSADVGSSVKDRFLRAIDYLKDSQSGAEVLVQLWVPVKREEHLVLTTYSQPFFLNENCDKLVKYREVSASYQFPAEKDSGDSLGLPGRVFLERVPEWTPDVRYFASYEYPRVDYAQMFGVRGSIALPVFEGGGHSCLGVVEVVMTTQKINYSYEVDNICSALKAVNLRTSEVLTIPRLKVISGSYHAALPEIFEVLRTICETHALPLAQTWIPCIQQGRHGPRHSDENYNECVCTVDDTCYVNDLSVMGFHQACSEYHLFRGQGVAGKAFMTNQPCFSSDITTYCKAEYPLSHHARIFGLRGAVAIRLRSTCTGTADFVLEFFLPKDCTGIEEQKLMLGTLSSSVQSLSRTLRVMTVKELEDEAVSHMNELIPSDVLFQKYDPVEDVLVHDDDNVNVTPDERQKIEIPAKKASDSSDRKEQGSGDLVIKELKDGDDTVVAVGNTVPKFKLQNHDVDKDGDDLKDSFCGGSSSADNTKVKKRRRRKTEKTVSLQVLRNYFAGSLKDAAKSLGLCPTTLKRICRMHGITRWPSRKIKKVDHSLKKLQVVIDSVHGANSGIQLSSLYKDISMTSTSRKGKTPTLLEKNENTSPNQQQQNGHDHHHSSSHSSAYSQKSSPSPSYSSGEKKCSQIDRRENGNAQLNTVPQTSAFPDGSQGAKSPGEHCSSETFDSDSSPSVRVKATFGSDKVRLRLGSTWGFQDLKREILTRFDIVQSDAVKLRYLDDDSEWVLLTCDADLHECIRIHRSSGLKIINIVLDPVSRFADKDFFGIIGHEIHEHQKMSTFS